MGRRDSELSSQFVSANDKRPEQVYSGTLVTPSVKSVACSDRSPAGERDERK